LSPKEKECRRKFISEKLETAEDYHQNYFEKNQTAPYCNFIIAPKIQKLLERYGKDIKDDYKRKDY